jgi:hypothetical protein
MGNRRGSALVLAMLLLVLLSAAGMYVVSRPSVPSGEGALPFRQAAVARNLARAGAHAAIARLPVTPPDGTPYVRRLQGGPDPAGQYSVTVRKTGRDVDAPGRGTEPTFERYEIVSDGSVPGSPAWTARVRAEVRFGPLPSPAPGAKIRKWEETWAKKGIDDPSGSRI